MQVPVIIEDLSNKLFDKQVSVGIRENYKNQLRDIVNFCNKAISKYEQDSLMGKK